MSRWNRNSEEKPKNSSRWNQDGKTAEDKAFDLFADMLIKKLESFKGNWKQPWIETGGWPQNIYGRRYNGMNALMLFFETHDKNYTVPVFATHAKINALNYDADGKPLLDESGAKLPFLHINKGEKSFPIILSQVNVVNPETKEKIKYRDYLELPEEERKKFNVYFNRKVYSVFNIDQTNMKEARPEMYEKFVSEGRGVVADANITSFEAADVLVSDNRWVCPIEHGNVGACYNPSKDVIVVPPKNLYKNGNEYYSTLFHEMTHSTGHKDRFDRFKPGQHSSTPAYAKEELVAEIGSVLTCQRFGITKTWKDEVTENSAAYLNGWLQNLKEEPSYIRNVMTDVKNAVSMITTRIELVEKELGKNEKIEGRLSPDNDVTIDDDGNAVETDTEHVEATKKEEELESNEVHHASRRWH